MSKVHSAPQTSRRRFYTALILLLSAIDGAASALAPAGGDQLDDPKRDGWKTEAFQKSAQRQLELLVSLPSDPQASTKLAELITGDVSCGRLRPKNLTEVFSGPSLRVLKAASKGTEDTVRHGHEGLLAALRELPGLASADARFQIKVVGVDLEATSATTRQLFSLTAPTDKGRVEHHATWEARWILGPSPDSKPRLRSLRLLDGYQESHFLGDGSSLFSDQTTAVLGDNAAFTDQLSRGTWSWLGELEAALGHDFAGHSGLAIGDVDGDGLEDLYVSQSGGLPNRLFMRRADGTLVDRSAWAGLDWLDRTHSALFADFDGDGDQDLAVALAPALLMMENDGQGRFTRRLELESISYAYSLAAADFDLDGDLDLYATRYNPLHDELGAEADVPTPLPYHDAENGARNALLRNDSLQQDDAWRFTDVTEATGLDVDNRRWSFAAAWEDYDNDGDPDLYVANDFGRNCLYRNDGGRFVNVAPQTGVEDVASGMSAAWGDADRDGWMDLYVGNMFSSAGHRVTYQQQFQPDMADATRDLVRRLARGNSLYLNRGDQSADGGEPNTFVDASLSAGVTMGRWSWGSIFADLDNDGWQDLVVANGYLTTPESGDL